MPGWKDVVKEIAAAGSANDVVRRKYVAALAEKTQRNVILYYSGWLQKSHLAPFVGQGAFAVSDADKSAFMAVIHELDRAKGLDLVLHTPGGDTAATESLVQYLHEMFGHNIRAIVPQLAMSAGTMIACACEEIVMGAHSSLGPIDPQFNGVPAHGVVEEFERARREIAASPANIPLWQPIIAKYSPTFVGECEKSLKWSQEIVAEWLASGMFAKEDKPLERASAVVDALGDHEEQRSHARHISFAKAQDIGLKIVELEKDKELQDLVLSVHHACIQTFLQTPAIKIVENQIGVGAITAVAVQQQFGAVPPSPSNASGQEGSGGTPDTSGYYH
ncbi:MAG: SDH family Clp fold serine proteinase [Vulcanimicrobiaceae bacterium]